MFIGIVVQTRTINEMRVIHTELLCPVVHHFYDTLFASGYAFTEGCARIIRRTDNRRFQKLMNRHCFAVLEPDL